MSTEELIERLEKETGPSRELDGRIYAYLNGRVFFLVFAVLSNMEDKQA